IRRISSAVTSRITGATWLSGRGHHQRTCHCVAVTEAYRHHREAEAFCTLSGCAMQKNQRLATVVLQNLDLAPHKADEAGTQGLRGGLFAREASRKLRVATPADGLLACCPNSVNKASAPPLDGCADALNLDNIDTALQPTIQGVLDA